MSGKHHVPLNGAVILCSNHSSLWDPPILASPLSRKVHYMAKSELFRIPIFNKIIAQLGAFPVKRNGISKESIKTALHLLSEGKVIGIFPEGSRKVTIGAAQKGAASLALKSKATLIPVAIVGNYRLFKPMKVIYGSPLDLNEFQGSTSDDIEQATEKMMFSIRTMHQMNR